MITLLVCEVIQKETFVAFQASRSGHAIAYCLAVNRYQFNRMRYICHLHDSPLPMAVTIFILRVCALHSPHRKFGTIVRIGNEAEKLDVEKGIGKI